MYCISIINKSLFTVVCFCSIIFNTAYGYLCAQVPINKIVASVAGDPITYYDILVAMYPQLQESGLSINDKNNDARIKRMEETALNDIINTILIRQEAEKYNLRITDQDIDSEMRKIARENNTSVDVLEQQIRIQGNNVETFKKNLRNNLLQQRMIGSFVFRKIIVTVQEVEEYYKKHPEEFRTDAMYSLSFIKTPTSTVAKQIIDTIRSSSTTFALARKAYANKYGESSIGNIDNLAFSELSSEWQQSVSNAKQGDTVGPVLVENDYFILHVDKKEDGNLLPFEDVYTIIEGKIRDTKFSSQYAEFIQSLRAKADIKIYQ